MEEFIVLVDENNNELGAMPKPLVHHSQTPLHRGFSVFIFNNKKEVLLQQRSHLKQTWPLVWSNSCCGHPGPGESVEQAAIRRLAFELDLHNVKLHIILPDYRYRCEKDGIVENEICPVLIGFTNEQPRLNPDEVESIKYMRWEAFLEDLGGYSPWCREEAPLLSENGLFRILLT